MAESFIGVRRKPCRQISGEIRTVMLTKSGPFPPTRRAKGSHSKGLTYERKFLKFLERQLARGNISGKLFSHHWLRFIDADGPGWAQPDFFIDQSDSVLIFETKLTQTDAAWEQLDGLYGPLLESLFRKPVRKVQVCKNLRVDTGTLITRLEDIYSGCTFHWTR